MKFLGYWESIGAGQTDNGQFNKIEDVDYVSGAALAIKREVIEKIGLLDPEFYAYAEDADLSYRARKAGYRVVTSDAVVYHYGSLSWDHLPIKKAYLDNRNHIYLIMKHYSPKTLLRYVVEYPIKSFKIDLCRFMKGETVLQRVKKPSENTRQGKTSILALNIVFLRTAMFLVALLLMMVHKAKLSGNGKPPL